MVRICHVNVICFTDLSSSTTGVRRSLRERIVLLPLHNVLESPTWLFLMSFKIYSSEQQYRFCLFPRTRKQYQMPFCAPFWRERCVSVPAFSLSGVVNWEPSRSNKPPAISCCSKMKNMFSVSLVKSECFT
jgi:hypothetical protein